MTENAHVGRLTRQSLACPRPMDEPPVTPTFEIQVPPELETGAYANFLSVWHSPYEFTLDFGVALQAQPTDPEDESAGVIVPARVVSRVKIPTTVIFDVLRALNENMTRYEASFGDIRRPGEAPTPRPETDDNG
jgi:Protein of unknown function (DUF3467)